jgi:hypothetical protein
MKKDFLTYVWDNEAPKGLITKIQALMKKIRYVVVPKDGPPRHLVHGKGLCTRIPEGLRDVDGGEPGGLRWLRFYINSQNTKSQAEGFIGKSNSKILTTPRFSFP